MHTKGTVRKRRSCFHTRLGKRALNLDAAGTQPDHPGQASSRQAGGLRSGYDQEEADGGPLEEGPPRGWGAPLSHGISGAWRRGRPGDRGTAVPRHQWGLEEGPPRGWGHRCPTASVGPRQPGLGAPASTVLLSRAISLSGLLARLRGASQGKGPSSPRPTSSAPNTMSPGISSRVCPLRG